MNLLDDPWIWVRRTDGTRDQVSLCEIVQPDIVCLDFPRQYSNAVVLQFLVGLLHTVPLQKEEEWETFFSDPPNLRECWEEYREALDLEVFMQFPDAPNDNEKQVSWLFFDAPSENALNQGNQDIFMHVGGGGDNGHVQMSCLCEKCVTPALLECQTKLTNNPAQKGNVRSNLLISYYEYQAELVPEMDLLFWRTLWLNVLPHEEKWDVLDFPWMCRENDLAKRLSVWFDSATLVRLGETTEGFCSVCGHSGVVYRSVCTGQAKGPGPNQARKGREKRYATSGMWARPYPTKYCVLHPMSVQEYKRTHLWSGSGFFHKNSRQSRIRDLRSEFLSGDSGPHVFLTVIGAVVGSSQAKTPVDMLFEQIPLWDFPGHEDWAKRLEDATEIYATAVKKAVRNQNQHNSSTNSDKAETEFYDSIHRDSLRFLHAGPSVSLDDWHTICRKAAKDSIPIDWRRPVETARTLSAFDSGLRKLGSVRETSDA